MAVKNATQWTPPSGDGYVVSTGANQLVTNAGDSLITNAGDSLVTSDIYTTPRNPTAWTATGL